MSSFKPFRNESNGEAGLLDGDISEGRVVVVAVNLTRVEHISIILLDSLLPGGIVFLCNFSFTTSPSIIWYKSLHQLLILQVDLQEERNWSAYINR